MIVCTFKQLNDALTPLHQGDKAAIDRLHDIWKMGAPLPDSLVRDPRHFDERIDQPGNIVQRVVLPTQLVGWIMEVSKARGFAYTERQAYNMAIGRIDLGLDEWPVG